MPWCCFVHEPCARPKLHSMRNTGVRFTNTTRHGSYARLHAGRLLSSSGSKYEVYNMTMASHACLIVVAQTLRYGSRCGGTSFICCCCCCFRAYRLRCVDSEVRSSMLMSLVDVLYWSVPHLQWRRQVWLLHTRQHLGPKLPQR